MEDMTDMTEYGIAEFWYLKGFKDAETTETQPISLEDTMRDAKVFFGMVWDCHKKQQAESKQ